MENKNLSWTTKEFAMHKKSFLWYVAFVVITLGLVAYGWYSHNILTLATFIVLSASAFIVSHQTPQDISCTLTPTGVVIGQNSFPYRNIKKFWILYTPENKTLNFETTAYLNNHVTVMLGKQDPLAVKQFLKTYLPEDLEKEESFTDILSRKIKF